MLLQMRVDETGDKAVDEIIRMAKTRNREEHSLAGGQRHRSHRQRPNRQRPDQCETTWLCKIGSVLRTPHTPFSATSSGRNTPVQLISSMITE